MCWLIRSPRSQHFLSQTSLVVQCLSLTIALMCSACGTVPRQEENDQYIRVENQNHFQIRAYVAFESSSGVRVLLGTVDPNGREYFKVPSALRGTRPLIVRCEKGRPGGLTRQSEYFETAFVSIPRMSTLVVTIRDPMRYSDYSICSMD